MEKEISGRQWDDRMDSFSRCEFLGRNFVCAGLLYNSNSEYLNNMAKLVKKFIDKQNVSNELKEFLENLGYKISGDALYSKYVVNRHASFLNVIKSNQTTTFDRKGKTDKLNIVEVEQGNPSYFPNQAGLVFLRVIGYEDLELSDELKYDLRQELLEEWLKVAEDQWVKEYLEKAKDMLKHIKDGVYGDHFRFPFSTVAYYLFPINFYRFENVILVSNVSMYSRKHDTKQNLWQKLLKDDDIKDLKEHLQDEGKNLRDLEEILEQAFKQENLNRLRKDWVKFVKKILTGKINSTKLIGTFLKKTDKEKKTSLSYGFYEVPAKNLDLYVFCENGMDKKYIDELKNKLSNFISNVKYSGGVKVSIKDPKPIYSLFGGKEYFEILKGLDGNSRELKHEESFKLLNTLMYFTARLNGFLKLSMKQRESMPGVLLLLNADLENDQRYAFWNNIRFLYDYYGLPFQTVTKRSISSLNDKVIKNMLISLYKDSKILHFEFDGFKLPEEVVIHIILERPSSSFFYEKDKFSQTSASRHYMYDVYTIQSKGNRAQIQLEDKFFVMCDGFGDDVEKLREYIKQRIEDQHTRFCFITALKDGYAKVLYEDMCAYSKFERKSLFVGYKELKTAYVSPKADSDCLIIYTQQFKDLAKALGIRLEKDSAAIAIKPARPSRRFDDIYHPALQVFYTEKIGWSSDEVYSQQHNLFLFTLIALSMYESEAFQVPYGKLSIHSKEKNIYLRISRQADDGVKTSFLFPLGSILYELLEFFRHLPGSEEID
ncbi:MAG: hypothetical protein QXP07_00670 [Candidatus Parvarchaeum sp.]|nr:hypothetical protein [Candidatus Parvarchaeum tengchongense]